jgi:hypothetical protein
LLQGECKAETWDCLIVNHHRFTPIFRIHHEKMRKISRQPHCTWRNQRTPDVQRGVCQRLQATAAMRTTLCQVAHRLVGIAITNPALIGQFAGENTTLTSRPQTKP